jgi:predicted ribosomally synthesized peptide with SipW-like signal peptide
MLKGKKSIRRKPRKENKMSRIFKSFFIIFTSIAAVSLFTSSYFSDSVTVSGNTIQIGTWPVSPGRIVINEVLYNPLGADTGNEFIELYNSGGSSVNMSGWQMGTDSTYYSLPTFSLGSDAFVIIHWDASGTNDSNNLYTGSLTNLSNTAGSVFIFNNTTKNSSTIVDFLEYGASGQTWESTASSAGIWTSGSFISNVAEGHSISRNPNGKDTNSISDFIDQSNPTPGS